MLQGTLVWRNQQFLGCLSVSGQLEQQEIDLGQDNHVSQPEPKTVTFVFSISGTGFDLAHTLQEKRLEDIGPESAEGQ